MLWYARKDTYLKRVMVIGAGMKAQQLEGLRRKTDRIGIDIVGYIDMPGTHNRAVSEDRIVKRVNGEPFLYAEFGARTSRQTISWTSRCAGSM